MAVDPSAPGTPQQISSGPISSKALSAIGHGTFNATTNTVSDLHTRTIIYAEGGKLWKVSTFKADGLTPTQVSSETGANNICQNIAATDLNNHNNAAYLYELAGSDSDCATSGDNLWRMARVGMNNSTAPFGARRPITSIDESTTGAHLGWLVDDNVNKKLVFYNADFTTNINVKDINGADVSYLSSIAYYAPINIIQEVLRIDNTIGTYTVDTNIWKPRVTITTTYPDSHFVREGGYLYFADYGDLNQSTMGIYRNIMTGTTSELIQLFGVGGFDATKDELTLRKTNNKLIAAIYQQSAGQTYVNAMEEAVANPPYTTLTGGAVSGNIRSFVTGGTNLYYSVDQTTSYLTDGTDENYSTANPPTPNLSSGNFDSATSAWLGAIQPNQYWIGNTIQPETVFLATGFNAATGFAGGTLTRYDAATATKGSVLGTIPPGIKEVIIEGNKPITLANGLRDDGHNDIFFVDIDTPDSLTRITNDVTDEIIVDAYH